MFHETYSTTDVHSKYVNFQSSTRYLIQTYTFKSKFENLVNPFTHSLLKPEEMCILSKRELSHLAIKCLTNSGNQMWSVDNWEIIELRLDINSVFLLSFQTLKTSQRQNISNPTHLFWWNWGNLSGYPSPSRKVELLS